MRSNEKLNVQQPIVDLLVKMGYKELTNKDVASMSFQNSFLLEDVLKEQLKKINDIDDYIAEEAMKFLNARYDTSLMKTNQKIYNYLRLGESFDERVKGKTVPVKYVDFDNVENNVFHVAKNVYVKDKNNEKKEIDIIGYINGIPLIVMECKEKQHSISQAIKQSIRNYNLIPDLFKFNQLIIATNKINARYGAIGTPKEYFLRWKEQETEWHEKELDKLLDGKKPTEQDKLIISLMSKSRVLDIIENFILFEHGLRKIIPRHQQYFTVKKIFKRIQEFKTVNGVKIRKGGIVYHYQGSGKSYTMIYASRYIFNKVGKEIDFKDGKILVVLDRLDLEHQTRENFSKSDSSVSIVRTGAELKRTLENINTQVIITTIYKFETAIKENYLLDSENVIVLVDEAHRTQWGDLNKAMRSILPKASLIGFTGTPLITKERNNIKAFGDFIDIYNMNDALEDKVVVPLVYDYRFIPMNLDEESFEKEFNKMFKGLPEASLKKVKNKVKRFSSVASSEKRLRLIVADIEEHYNENLKGTDFRAIFATQNQSVALKYKELFEEMTDLKVKVVISKPDTRYDDKYSETEEVGESSTPSIDFYKSVIDEYGDMVTYEDKVKEELRNGDIDIVIVVNKWLVGVDIPNVKVLYNDKSLQLHLLMQAYARPNRAFKGKTEASVVDYYGLVKETQEAYELYTNITNKKVKDIGMIKDYKKFVDSALTTLKMIDNIFSSIKIDKDTDVDHEYANLLLNDKATKKLFYNLIEDLKIKLSTILKTRTIYDSITPEESRTLKRGYRKYYKIKQIVDTAELDEEDYDVENERLAVELINKYISPKEPIRLLDPVNLAGEEFLNAINMIEASSRSKAELIASKINKTITSNSYTEKIKGLKISEELKSIMLSYQKGILNSIKLLERTIELYKLLTSDEACIKYPEKIIKNKKAITFFNILKADTDKLNSFDDNTIAELSLKIDEVFKKMIKVDWTESEEVIRNIKFEIIIRIYEKTGVHLDENNKVIQEIFLKAKDETIGYDR